MESNKNKVRVFFIKIIKILLAPISRIRKFIRKFDMRQRKISIGFIALIFNIVLVIFLYRLSITMMKQKKYVQTTAGYVLGTPMRRVPLDEVYKDIRSTNDDKDNVIDDEQSEPVGMVNTLGCKIPIAMIDYEKYVINSTKRKKFVCGKRAVFVRKYDSDKVIVRIKKQILKQYAENETRIECCYQFIIDSIQFPHERPKLIFSNCTIFQHEAIVTLQTDFINIVCSGHDGNNISNIVYDDIYAFTRKKYIPQPKPCTSKYKYNVLMLGLDSMSLPRAVKTLPRTIAFLKGDSWLGFRGYHKIADNTLPNLLAVLTGKNMTRIIKQCFGQMDECKEFFIWNAFKKAGYVTAYGEDNLQLPDTFTKEYAFNEAPTDHYIRPFFLKGEIRRYNKSLLCAGKIPSGQQLLDYALDFANTYKKDSFFGLFWINSFSHDPESHPENADKILENFLNQLAYTGIMTNTFVILFSGHGIRFGSLRLKVESYYDERMPMNFMWPPLVFRGIKPYELRAMTINQFRLITPYDIYSTLINIKEMSDCSNLSNPAPVPEGCANCHSIFNVVSNNRTCQDAAIHDKWCSCHKLFPLPIQDPIGIKSVYVAVNHIKNMAKTIETQQCWGCMTPSLKEIVRIHFYYSGDKTSIFYVVAFTMSPGDISYEATLLRKGNKEYDIIGPISLISTYKGLGKCTLNRRDRKFCVCKEKLDC